MTKRSEPVLSYAAPSAKGRPRGSRLMPGPSSWCALIVLAGALLIAVRGLALLGLAVIALGGVGYFFALVVEFGRWRRKNP